MDDLSSYKVGWIGTGVMGRWMCEHLHRARASQATVYNRTKDTGANRSSTREPMGAVTARRGGGVRRRVRDRRLPEGRARGVPRHRWRAGGHASRARARGHDDERAVAGRRDLRRARRRRDAEAARRPGVRRRRRCEERGAVDHDRRRRGRRSSACSRCSSAWARRSSTRAARRGPAHEDGATRS